MTPFFLGDPASAILCLLTPPARSTDRDHGVLICPPVGQEHVRAHWALRQLATSLSRAGFHTLRFDWFGVGDSAGELADATVARWRQDLADAARALREHGGVQEVALVGLRLGATLAALGAAAVRPSAIVLWDPVVEGKRYLDELGRLSRTLAADPHRYWELPEPAHRMPEGELVGFDYSPGLRTELAALDLGAGQAIPRVPLGLVRSSDGGELEAFAARLVAAGRDVTVRDTAVRASWTLPDDIERLLLPGDATGVITELLEASTA